MHNYLAMLFFVLAGLLPVRALCQVEGKSEDRALQLEIAVEDQLGMRIVEPGLSIVLDSIILGKQTARIVLDNQFIVASNTPYSITVTAAKAYLVNDQGQIPISAISMTLVGIEAAEWRNQISSLSTRPQPLAKMAPPTLGQPYSIAYRVKPDRRVAGATAGSYRASLMFTMTQE